MIVCDSYSMDGAWEIIQSYAQADARISARQVPKEGIYAGWNECLRRARGEFIYIATSDDTMEPDCLEKLLAALKAHPECGVAMCALDFIDEHGVSFAPDKNWRAFPAAQFFQDWFDRPHVRLAPLDGVLSGTLHCIWHSVTQLLIRHSAYERHGLYRTDLGSIADFEWNARVGFFENVVYIPDMLATLRVHEASASVLRKGYSVEDMSAKIRVLELAFDYACSRGALNIESLKRAEWIHPFLLQRWLYALREMPVRALCQAIYTIVLSPLSTFRSVWLVLRYAMSGKEGLRKAFTLDLIMRAKISLPKHLLG